MVEATLISTQSVKGNDANLTIKKADSLVRRTDTTKAEVNDTMGRLDDLLAQFRQFDNKFQAHTTKLANEAMKNMDTMAAAAAKQ